MFNHFCRNEGYIKIIHKWGEVSAGVKALTGPVTGPMGGDTF